MSDLRLHGANTQWTDHCRDEGHKTPPGVVMRREDKRQMRRGRRRAESWFVAEGLDELHEESVRGDQCSWQPCDATFTADCGHA